MIKYVGFYGERLAGEYLSDLGYVIVERNYRCRYGEIDLIAYDNSELVFIEVKTRRSLYYGSLAESIDIRKQKKIYFLADFYLQRLKVKPLCRFDVVLLYLDSDFFVQELSHIKNAF